MCSLHPLHNLTAGVPRHSSPFGRGQARRIGSRYVGEAGEGVFKPNLEFTRPSSPFAALGYFSQKEKNVRLIAAVTNQPTEWIAPAGTLD